MLEKEILARTYYDVFDVYRPMITEEGAFNDFEKKHIYQKQKGALSFVRGSTQSPSETTQSIQYIAMLFCYPHLQINAGDRVFCREKWWVVGEPVTYVSHLEIPLMREDVA